MPKTFIYKTDDPMVRFIQITDPHLFQDEKGELLGINTQASFCQVLNEIQQTHFDYDLILATGDLVQDSSDQGYISFCRLINQLAKPTFWIPGNHDFQPKMVEYLASPQEYIYPAKQLLLGEHWQVLLLDSQEFGVPRGRLSQYQLNWLVDRLKECPERYALITLHHHILSTHSEWLDQHNLRNANELAEALAPFPRVKAILHGHIHQQVDSDWQGYRIMSTPSTCVQFKPEHNQFTLDTLQPGWREIELHPDGSIQTRVKRIQHASFLPNMHEEGY